MAVNLSNDWPLSAFMATVRSQSETLSEQKKLLLRPQLKDLVHLSIVNVRRVVGRLIDGYYIVTSGVLTVAGTKPDYTVSLAALKTTGIYDFMRASLRDATLGKIPVLPRDLFDSMKDVYTSADIGATAGIATIDTSVLGVPSILIYSDAALSTVIAALRMAYIRSVTKVILNADTVDLPDQWVPLAIDVCTKKVFEKGGQKAPEEVEARIKSSAADIATLLNADIQPATL